MYVLNTKAFCPLSKTPAFWNIFLMKTPESPVIHLASAQLSLCTRDQIENPPCFSTLEG